MDTQQPGATPRETSAANGVAASHGRGGARNRPGGEGGPRGRRGQITTSPPEYDSKTVAIDRVSRMQAGGRRFRFRATVVIGNRKGSVGLGVGKAPDVRSAVEKATRRAHANKIVVPRKGGTIPREIEMKVGPSVILMRPARPGHGVVAGGVVRVICELAGIEDISTKILSRSSNTLANARATIEGLEQLSKRVAVARARRETNNKQQTTNDEKSEALS